MERKLGVLIVRIIFCLRVETVYNKISVRERDEVYVCDLLMCEEDKDKLLRGMSSRCFPATITVMNLRWAKFAK